MSKTNSWYLTAAIVEASLQNTCTKIDSLIADLNFMVTMYTRAQLPRCQQQSQNILQIDPVGIEDQAAAVKNMPDLDSNTRGAARAVVKTSLAEYVISKCSSLEGLQLSVICIDDKILQSTKLQEQIIFDVGGKRIDLRDYKEGQRELSNVLENQLCFLLIDNVVDKNHVQEILPRKLYLPFQSRMLITSRENNMRQVVDLECKEYSSIECLPRETARKLLHQIILDGGRYETNEKEKIDAVADACGGVPLLLEVYGKVLRDNRMESAYDEALASLQKREHGAYKEENLSAKLLFVYHKMRDGDTKDAFLDICCFFHGWQGDKVSAIVDEGELVALNIGALLKINGGNQVIVHDVIKVMGIDKAKHNLTHLQSLQDLKMALEENKCKTNSFACMLNLNKIKGIWLPHNIILSCLESKNLDAMCDSLWVLAIGDWIKPEGQYEKQFKNLRYLDVGDIDAFPFNEASKIENQTVLYSKSVGARDFPELPNSLKWLRLISMPDDTTEVPRIGWSIIENMRHLQWFEFQGFNVSEFPAKFVLPKLLSELDFNGCEQLKNLPQQFEHLSALTDLTLDRCKSLREFPKTVGGLYSLKCLSMKGCENLIELPKDLGSLSYLHRLILKDCKNLKTLPENVGNLVSLKEFTISGCKSLAGLPTGFGNLLLLKSLDLSECESFVELPESLGNLYNILKGVGAVWLFEPEGVLMSLPDGFGCNLTNLEILRVRSCDKFEQVSSDFECLTSLRSLDLSRCPMLEVMTMDKVVRLKNLFFVYIEGSVKLEEKWEQMQKAEDQYSLVVIASKMLPNSLKWLRLVSMPDDTTEVPGTGWSIIENMRYLQWFKFQGFNVSEFPAKFVLPKSLLELDFNGCEQLKNLPQRFEYLSALTDLTLDGCKSLFWAANILKKCEIGREVGTNAKSGRSVFLGGYHIKDVQLNQRWNMFLQPTISFSLTVFVVVLSFSSRVNKGELYWRAAGAEFFCGQCQLVDLNGQCIPSSQFTITLDSIFVITYTNYSPWKFEPQVFQKMVERLTSESCSPIIYVEVDNLFYFWGANAPANEYCDEENIHKILELLPDGSCAISSTDIKTRSLLGDAAGLHGEYRKCGVIIVDVKADEKGLKHFVHCNDISRELWREGPATRLQLVNIGALEAQHCNFEAVWAPTEMSGISALLRSPMNYNNAYGFGSCVRRTKSMPWLLFPDPT
eukprot:Gb_16722 [translate_table: standard]